MPGIEMLVGSNALRQARRGRFSGLRLLSYLQRPSQSERLVGVIWAFRKVK